MALGAFSLTHLETVEAQAGWVFAFRVAILLGLFGTVLASRWVSLRGDPLAIGLVAGLAIASARHLVLVEAPPLPSPAGHDLIRITVLAVLTCGLAASIFRLEEFPRWARARVVAGMLLLGLGSAVGGIVALPTGLLGAVLLAGTAAAVLHQAIEAEKQEVEDLHLRLHTVELGVREDRARLHEINSTVAGIASAQKLMAEGLSADRSDALAAMMRAEVERLQRLVADRVPTRHRSVDLDEVIGQIVLSHLARGRVVVWEPSGLRAMGRADDIAEVVNVLLENAAVHGGPDAVSVAGQPRPRRPRRHRHGVRPGSGHPTRAARAALRLGCEPAGLPRPGHRPARRRRHHPRAGRPARAAADRVRCRVRDAPARRTAGGER